MAEVADEIWTQIAEYVGAEGLELDDLEVAGGHGTPVLRVVLDGPDGINVDHLAELSRGIGRLLEGGRYDAERFGLEVSSPGLERKLRRPAHWTKAIGSQVVVKTHEEIDGSRRHEGTVASADDEGAEVSVDGSVRRIRYDVVASARTVFIWDRGAKPGRTKESR